MLRGIANENEVITFGFFDGTVEQLKASQDELGHNDRRAAIETIDRRRDHQRHLLECHDPNRDR